MHARDAAGPVERFFPGGFGMPVHETLFVSVVNPARKAADDFLEQKIMQIGSGEKTVRVYRPDAQAGWRGAVWREMAEELIQSRELIWQLFLRDFSARYRQSVLGVLWAVIMPLAMVATFAFLSSSGVLNVGKVDAPYPVYALLGLTIWQLFAGGLTICSNAIVAGGSIVVKINFPKETMVIASLGQALVEMLIRMGLLVLALIYYRVTPHWTAVFFPILLLPLFLLTLGLGFFLSLLNVLVRDIGNMVTLAATFLLFLTPVLYPAGDSGMMARFTALNPLAALVGGPRDMVITGRLTDPFQYAWATGFCVLVFFVSWRLFHMVEPRMAERV
jgi:lipopolysaccharide transport system permease protein